MNNKYIARPDNTFCPEPYAGLQISPKKEIKPCCMYNDSWGSFDGSADALGKAFHSEDAIKMRMEMLENKWPKGCIECQEEELETGSSKRLIENSLKDLPENYLKELSFDRVELFFSNVCNMDCIMCTPGCSTSWNQPLSQMSQKVAGIRGFEPTTSKSLTETELIQILERSKNALEVTIIGGEPFASPNIDIILDYWTINNKTSTLNITTNGTLISPAHLKKLSSIQNLELNISIDGIGLLYEWIRGYSWEKLVNQLDLLKENKISYTINATIGLHNLEGLIEFQNFFMDRGDSFKMSHIITNPKFLSPLNLPLHYRQSLKEKFQYPLENELNVIIKGDNLEDSKENLSKAHDWITFFNSYRNLNLFNLYPNLENEIKASYENTRPVS